MGGELRLREDGGIGSVPGVRDDDIVKRRIALAEAGEPDAHDHC